MPSPFEVWFDAFEVYFYAFEVWKCNWRSSDVIHIGLLPLTPGPQVKEPPPLWPFPLLYRKSRFSKGYFEGNGQWWLTIKVWKASCKQCIVGPFFVHFFISIFDGYCNWTLVWCVLLLHASVKVYCCRKTMCFCNNCENYNSKLDKEINSIMFIRHNRF